MMYVRRLKERQNVISVSVTHPQMRMAPSARSMKVCLYAGTSSMTIYAFLQYALKVALLANSPAPSARICPTLMPVRFMKS
jgi:hypothetical protein